MPKTLGEIFKALALKAGAKEDNEHIINELAAPDFARLTVSDDLYNLIDNGLLSVETAKNNHPEIKKHYTALAYNGLDSEINTLMDELQVDDAMKARVLNERSSTKRAALLTKLVKEAEEKKKASSSDKDKESLQKTINELNSQIAKEKETAENLKTKHTSELAEFKKEMKIDTLLNGYKTIFDELPAEARASAIKSLLVKELEKRDAVIKVDDKGQLVLHRSDGSNVFGDDHRQLNPQTLIDLVLSQNKLLKVTDAGAGGKNNGQNNSQNGKETIINNGNGAASANGNDGKKVNHTLKSLVGEALENIDKADKANPMK